MIDAILGIDVSNNTLGVSISSCTKVRTKEGVFETVHHQDRSIFYNQVDYGIDAVHLAEYARLAETSEGFADYLQRYVYERRAA